LLSSDSTGGVERNPALIREFGFGFRQKTGFGSKLNMFNLRTSSEPQFYRQFWAMAGEQGQTLSFLLSFALQHFHGQ